MDGVHHLGNRSHQVAACKMRRWSQHRLHRPQQCTIPAPSLLSLDDAVLELVLSQVVSMVGCQKAVKNLVLVCKRLAALMSGPSMIWAECTLTAWLDRDEQKFQRTTRSGTKRHGMRGRSNSERQAALLKWLATVAPAFTTMELRVRQKGDSTLHVAWEEVAACLLQATKLQSLAIMEPSIGAGELAHVAALTQLTSLTAALRLQCGQAPLANFEQLAPLSSLAGLRELSLALFSGPDVEYCTLPSQLAALTNLRRLEITGAGRLPRALCNAAVQLTALDLAKWACLPGGLDPEDDSILPALRQLSLERGRYLESTGVGSCHSVEVLRLDRCDIWDKGWEHLAGLPQLRQLALECCHIYGDYGQQWDSDGEGSSQDGDHQAQGYGAMLLDLEELSIDRCRLRVKAARLLANFPSLRDLSLVSIDEHWTYEECRDYRNMQRWSLPAECYLQHLTSLKLQGCSLSSIAPALPHAQTLQRLVLADCRRLQFERKELPLLLALPLREVAIFKRETSYNAWQTKPGARWTPESVWVLEGLRAELAARQAGGEEGLVFDISAD